jgi:HAE1 family hydrophobic/amphiphilic exporter-1
VYWLAEICVRRPVFALMIIAALVVAGIASFAQLGVDRFPNMDLPTAYVRTVYPGAASQEVESEVSQIIEDAVATVAGIDELRSISSDGTSIVIVTFNLNRNVDAAVQDVRDAVSSVRNRLPPGLDPPIVQKQDTDSSPIITLALSGQRSSSELYLLADRYVKNVIESAPGVGQVTIAGAAERAVQVEIDARRLAAYQLSILQVREALVRQNAEVPGGRVDEGRRERTLRTLGRIPHAREFPELTVATVGGAKVQLKDLGEVKDSTKEVRTLARLNGEPAVVLQVQRQSGENTVRVIDAVKERLKRSRELLPDDVQVTVIQDQSRYIKAALHEIEGHLVSGSILASITVLLFMRSWRSTFIAAVAIPTSIIATFAFMKWFGFTLNNVTMLALVLMVGVVIDDAIVVLENVFHLIEEKGMDPFQASIEGTKEIGPAVLATTLSLVIVFLPVSFLSSVTGRMLYEFGLTATVAIMVSMLVSFTLTPMMCSKLLLPAKPQGEGDQTQQAAASRRGPYAWLESAYMLCLRLSMRFRWAVLILVVLTILANWPLYQLVQQDYIPTNVDESEFEVSLTAPEGASLASMDDALRHVETQIREIPGVELLLVTVGTRGFGGVNRGEFYVRLSDIEGRSFSLGRLWRGLLAGNPGAAWEGNFTQRDKMNEVRSRLRGLKDLRASVRNLTSLRQGAPVDIDFSITGPDIEVLAEFSEKLRQRAMEIPGIVDVDTTLKLDKPELLVSPNRERADALGVDTEEIAQTLRVAVGGDDRVSRYRDSIADDAYDVELRLVNLDRRDTASISQLYVRARPVDMSAESFITDQAAQGSGPVMTRIDNVVDFQFGTAPARIDRLDRQRMVAVRANVAAGYALGDRITALQLAADEIGIPPGFDTRVMGRGRELERTLADFFWTFLLSFVFMYIVLAAQYEHLVHPFTILLSLPLAVPFGLLSLYWGGETLNLYSALGLLVLFGVVKKAAILQVDHTNALRSQGLPRLEAILQANRDRLRPILMTTLSFVAGLLPLLISTGPGAEERRSIAVLAVGGQMLSLLLTLLAVPVIYSYLDDIGLLYHWFMTPRTPAAAPPATTPPTTTPPSPRPKVPGQLETAPPNASPAGS